MKREEIENKIELLEANILHYKDVNKLHKQAKKERKQLKKQLEELPKLEVGKWYKGKYSGFRQFLFCYTENDDGDIIGYGFSQVDRDLPWNFDICAIFGGDGVEFELAEDSYVQTALIEEAKKRGFKEGVRVSSVNFPNGSWLLSSCPLTKCGDYFTLGGCSILKDGKWATIIEQKKVSISGDYTKEDLEKIIETEFK